MKYLKDIGRFSIILPEGHTRQSLIKITVPAIENICRRAMEADAPKEEVYSVLAQTLELFLLSVEKAEGK